MDRRVTSPERATSPTSPTLIMGWAIMLNCTIFVYFKATFTSLSSARLPTPYRSRVYLKNNDSPSSPVFATLSTKNVLRADQ